MPNHKELLQFLSKQDTSLSRIYASMSQELAVILKRYKLNDNSQLWHRNKQVKKEVDIVLRKYRSVLFDHMKNSSKEAWGMADKHNDNFVKNYTKGITIPNDAIYYQRNTEALQAFLKRVNSKGVNLSKRVWNLTKQTQSQLEYFIADGLTEGRSAVKLAGDLQRYLKEPEKQFRRIRNPETGKLVLSNPAKDFHPGQGVYRSSYKNALRLARNEINIAYRTADMERRKNLDFVVGIKVNLSPAHPRYDICDELQGEYPKEFTFVGWHPNCLCFTTSKLLTKQEFINHLNGKGIPQQRYVRTIPYRATKYINSNSDRIKGLSNTPYFIKDNFKNTANGIELKKSVGIQTEIKNTEEKSIIKKLKSSGVTVNYNEQNYKLFEKNVKGFDLNTLLGELENQLSSAGINNINKSVYMQSQGFEFKLTSKNFEMLRKVNYSETGNTVYHAYLRLPESAQGSGLTKKMFQSLYKQYEAANITKINVTANIDVGGYAWARYGFSATKKSDVLAIINKSKDVDFKRLAKQKVNYHYNKYGNEAPFPMNRLAKIKGGKDALLNTNWSGTIDLNNKKEKEWFVNYLFD